jgi:hypothetical protein
MAEKPLDRALAERLGWTVQPVRDLCGPSPTWWEFYVKGHYAGITVYAQSEDEAWVRLWAPLARVNDGTQG